MPGFDDVDGRFGAKAEAAALDRVIARHGLSHLTDAERGERIGHAPRPGCAGVPGKCTCGIDDVDRMFGAKAVGPSGPIGGEVSEAERGVREDCAAAAAAIGDKVEEVSLPRDPHWPLPSFDAVDWGREFCRIMRERVQTAPDEDWVIGWFANALMRGHDEGVKRATAMAFEEQRSAEDRREVRRQALTLAVQSWAGTHEFTGGGYNDEDVLKTAGQYERYLLGDDEPPATGLCGGGDEPCLWPNRCLHGRCRKNDPPTPPAKME